MSADMIDSTLQNHIKAIEEKDELEKVITEHLKSRSDFAIDVEEDAEGLIEPHFRIDLKSRRICIFLPLCWNKEEMPSLIKKAKALLTDSLTDVNEKYEQLQKRLERIDTERKKLNGKIK